MLQIQFEFKIMKQENHNQHDRIINHPTMTELQLFAMTKEALIKRVQLLTHQLSIYYKIDKSQNLENNNTNFDQLNRQIIEKDIIIETQNRNNKIIQSLFDKIQIQCQQHKNTIAQKNRQINKLKHQIQIYKKKQQENEKYGGKVKIDKLEGQLKNQKQKSQQLVTDNNKKTRKCQELMNRVVILENLNSETEQKLVDALTSKIDTSKITFHQNQLPNKENIDQRLSQNKLKIQIYSLKEKIRCLRQDLRLSEESKQQLKSKIQQRQAFYSKMITSKK